MIAAVLCGGLGSRLRAVIGDHQKCAVEVGGRPWIHRVLDQLHASNQFERVICLTGYMAMEVEEAVKAWTRDPHAPRDLRRALDAPMNVGCLLSRPMGPEEAVQLAFKKTKAPSLLVMNGDTLVEDFPLAGFVDTCLLARRTAVVHGPSLLDEEEEAESGIAFRAPNTRPSVYPTAYPFLDIGSPEGLALARRKYAVPPNGAAPA